MPEEHRAPLLDELGRGNFADPREDRPHPARARRRRQVELLLSVPQLPGGPDVLHGPAGPVRRRGRAGLRDGIHRAARAGRREPRHLRSRAFARAGLLHGRDLRGLRPGRRACRSAAAGATTTCSSSSDASFRRSASRSRLRSCTSHSPRRSGCERPDDRRAARRAAGGDARLARARSRIPTAEVRGNERKLQLFEDVGLITMRPSDVPTYVAAGAA